jgi:hypothetical protein
MWLAVKHCRSAILANTQYDGRLRSSGYELSTKAVNIVNTDTRRYFSAIKARSYRTQMTNDATSSQENDIDTTLTGIYYICNRH